MSASSAAPTLLVTGASGFIGSSLKVALARGFAVRAIGRHPDTQNDCAVGDIGPDTDWSRALDGVDAVIHLAGPAHANTPATVLQHAVVGGSCRLAEQAAARGVRRFLYVSSIKAAADRTDAPIDETSPPRPLTAYGRAKLEAEGAVLEQFPGAIVLRPPLVHGPGVKGNLRRLMRLLDSNLPLPLAGFRNKRSLISLSSFCSASVAALTASDGPSGVFHVCDHPAVSTSEIAALLRQGMGRARGLFQMPGVASFAPAALGDSLEVDDSRFRASYAFSGADTRAALVSTGHAWRAAR
ncbi:MAG: NAD-dependent epimerase/dehydratase family protein [Caulobacteraceae bacterium]